MSKCLDVLLGEYKTASFDLQSKLQTFPESGKRYLPLNERIKMFVADNPNGSIECRVLADNNIFASVEAKITTDSGNSAIAVGKWYHNYTEEVELEPSGSQNVGDIFILDDNQEYIPAPDSAVSQGRPQNVTPRTEMTVGQAKSFIMSGAPFNGQSIGQILDSGNSQFITELKKRLTFAVQQGTTLAPAARVILPLIKE